MSYILQRKYLIVNSQNFIIIITLSHIIIYRNDLFRRIEDPVIFTFYKHWQSFFVIYFLMQILNEYLCFWFFLLYIHTCVETSCFINATMWIACDEFYVIYC